MALRGQLTTRQIHLRREILPRRANGALEEEMSNVIDLARARAEREGSVRLTVALDDGLYAFLPHQARLWRTADGRVIRYVPLSQLPAGARPDLVLGAYVPTAPGRELLLQSIEHFYEIDERGRVHRNGEILWAEPLTDYGTPRLWLPGQLRVGQEAALLFVSREEDGWNFRVFVTDPVLIAGRLPALRRSRFVPRGWLDAAIHALPRRDSGLVRRAEAAAGTEQAEEALT